MDIHAHEGRAEVAIACTRDWLVNVTRRQLIGSKKLIRWYHEFMAMLPSIADELDLDAAAASYVDFEEMLLQWLLNRKRSKTERRVMRRSVRRARHVV